MAEGDSSDEEKTEDPSERRLRQAREEGNVAVGRDFVHLASFLGGTLALLSVAGRLRDDLLAVMAATLQGLAAPGPRLLLPLLARPALFGVAVCVAVALATVIVSLAQTGGGFWPQLALPDPQRVWGGGRIGRLFKKETLVDFLASFVKIVALGAVLLACFRAEFVALPRLLYAGTGEQLAGLYAPLAAALVKVLTTLAVIGGLDFALTRYRHRRKMKMTKEEMKREYKEEEGDPLFRSRRRRRHRDLMKNVVKVEVPKADALIVNPTHIAIAIRYRPGEDKAPRVTAKGKGVLAETMRDLARQHGIPIVEDIPLARLLYRKVKVGRTVPAETYKAVAAVLAFVYRVLGRSGVGAGGAR